MIATSPAQLAPNGDRERRALFTLCESAVYLDIPASTLHQWALATDQLAARIGGNRACLALARKLLKRSYHLLNDLGDQAIAPVT